MVSRRPNSEYPLNGYDVVTLRCQIVGKFSGRTVDIYEVERFVIQDTAFLATHYRRRVLAVMEKEGPSVLAIDSAPPGRKRGTFPPGTRIRFGSSS